MKKNLGYVITALVLLLGCTKEEVTPRVFPRVSTVEAVDISSAGATFVGEIIYSSVKIIDHGFVWSDGIGPQIETANKVSLGSKEGIGSFEAKCDRSLESGKKYFLRAYAISDEFTVYGNTVEFISLGGKAPIVKDFYPAIGTWSDTVTIIGENFSDELRTNIVKFNNAIATVIKANKDTVQVKVPFDVNQDLSTVKVSVAGNSSNIEKQFQLRSPVIESVTPGIGLQGTKVTIKGNYLLSYTTKVYFGETEASVLNWSPTQIDCVVPNRPNGEVLLRVRTGTGGLFATSPFKIQPEHLPELHQVLPATAKYADIVKLIGNHFASTPGNNSVMFGNVAAEIISESETEIEVRVPDPDSRTPTITVTTYGSSVSINSFTMKPPVVTDYSPHRGMAGDVLTITGVDFSGDHTQVFIDDERLTYHEWSVNQISVRLPYTISKHESTIKVKFYDLEFVLSEPFKTPWIAANSVPEGGIWSSQTFVYNNAAYLALVGNGTNNHVWKFSGNTWTRMNDFPGIPEGRSLGSTFSFVAGGKAYIGGGAFEATEQSAALWEYDFATDTWTKQSDIPIPNYALSGFGLGNEGFVFEVDHVNYPNLWRYNATTDTWSIRSSNLNNVTGIGKSFVIGSNVYLHDYWGGLSFLRYTPSSNQWTSYNAPVFPNYAFSIGGFGYAGKNGGFYKFNPATNTWVDEVAPYFSENFQFSFSVNGKGYVIDNYGTVYEYDPNY